jgi:hypothetical protein
MTLDAQRRVSRVTVPADRQRRVGAEELSGEAVKTVRDASIRHLDVWRSTFRERSGDRSDH